MSNRPRTPSPTALVNAARRGPRRPLWVTVLIVVVALGLAILQHRTGPTQGGSQAGGQGSQAGTQGGSQGAPSTSSQARAATDQRAVPGRDAQGAPSRGGAIARDLGDGGIPGLFASRTSDAWVEATGVVHRVLPDDNETRDGSDRHQRFIVRLRGGSTVLVAHNIDTTDRVPLEEGDMVTFRGEYEWTEQGGTVHFTHAPKYRRRDPGGWIEHEGVRYE